MSYILEALRKADAQRERHRLPGLQAHASALPAQASPARRFVPRWGWIAMAAGVLALGLVAWQLDGGPPSPQEPPRVADQGAVAGPPPVVAAAPAEAPKPAAAIEPPPPPPAPPAARPPSPAPGQDVVVPAAEPPVARASAPPAAWPPAGAPALVVTGGIYSPDRAQRMLIVNGQVHNEGSEVAPGVTLERVAPRSAVLRFRGASYSIGY